MTCRAFDLVYRNAESRKYLFLDIYRLLHIFGLHRLYCSSIRLDSQKELSFPTLHRAGSGIVRVLPSWHPGRQDIHLSGHWQRSSFRQVQ